MKKFLEFVVGAAVVLVLLAGALLLVTALVPAVRKEAGDMARGMPWGRAGIFFAGLLAPIVYGVKKAAEWFAKTFLGWMPGQTGKASEIAKRTDEIEKRLNGLSTEVAQLNEERRRTLETEGGKLRTLEAEIARLRGRLGEIGAHYEELKNAPLENMTDEEFFERKHRQEGFTEVN